MGTYLCPDNMKWRIALARGLWHIKLFFMRNHKLVQLFFPLELKSVGWCTENVVLSETYSHKEEPHSFCKSVCYLTSDLKIKWLKAVPFSSSCPFSLSAACTHQYPKLFFTFIFMFSLMKCNCELIFFSCWPRTAAADQHHDVCWYIPAGWWQALWNKLGKTLHIFGVNPTTPHALYTVVSSWNLCAVRKIGRKYISCGYTWYPRSTYEIHLCFKGSDRLSWLKSICY